MEREPIEAAAVPGAAALSLDATLRAEATEALPAAETPICPVWSHLFDVLPVAPSVVAAGIAVALVASFLALDLREGRLVDLLAGVTPWWRHVEVRSALAVGLLFAGVAATVRYEEIGAREDLRRLAPHLRGDAECEAAVDQATRVSVHHDVRLAGLLGSVLFALVVPTLYRDPARFLRAETYLLPSVAFDLAVALVLGGTIVRTLYGGVVQDRGFARLAHAIGEIDLLELGPVHVFSRRGLRRALRWLVLASVASLVVFDAGRGGPPALVFLGIVVFALFSFWLPIRGAHERVRAEKQRVLAGVRARIRGERERVEAGTARGGRLADLLAYEARVQGVSEWPIDGFTLLRLACYLLLPLGSWLGGALVERLVNVVLG